MSATERVSGFARGRFARVLLPLTLAATSLVAATAPAAARPAPTPPPRDPISTAQSEAARLTKLLDAQGTALERAAERYNAAEQAASDAATKAELAESDFLAAQARETAALAHLRDAAVASYITAGEGHLPATLGAADGSQYVVRRHYIDVVASTHAHVVDDLAVAKAARQQAAETSRRLSLDARRAADDAKTAADVASAAQTETQATLAQVQGELADLVAAQQEAEQGAARAQWLAAHTPAPAAPAAPADPSVVAPATPAAPVAPVALVAPVVPGAPGTPGVPVPPPSKRAGLAIAAAQQQLGKPYLWGGTGPDAFDCSGLTLWAWRAAGVTLPRVAVDQKAATVPISFDQLAPGDLVFFGDDTHHVGLYVGNETMINAPHTGDVVRYSSIWWTDLAGFGRVVG